MKASAWIIAAATAALLGVGACRRTSTPAEPDPAVVEAVNRGVSLMGQYDYDGAAKAFEEALASAPDLSEVKVNLAIARFNRGQKESQDLEQSASLLDAVLQNDPANPRAWYFKGIVLQHQGQAEAAIPCFVKVLQQRPDDGVAWYLLGMCKQRVGRDAEKELLRAIELRPYLVSAYYRLWQTLQTAGQTARAAPYLERFKQLRESPLAETIELPQYNQMGELALVVPLGDGPPAPPPAFTYRAGRPREILRWGISDESTAPSASRDGWPTFRGTALADMDGDGQVDDVLCGRFAPMGQTPEIIAVGDYDNDEVTDVFMATFGENHLLRGNAPGDFTPADGLIAQPAAGGRTRSALWLDADHDGDLDLFVCNAGAPNQLFNNNADGTFTDIAAGTALAAPEGDSVMVLPGDIDGDRDMDLVLLRANAPARVFLNELSGKFREAGLEGAAIRGDLGGVLQDFDGDGLLDVLALGGEPAELKLFLGDGRGGFAPGRSLVDAAAALGPMRGLRVADVDLDGDLDVAVFGGQGHVLWNDATGRFTLQARVWSPSPGAELVGAELADLTGDLVPDLLLFEQGDRARAVIVPGGLSPPSTAIAIAPTGVRSRDKRTRSPASGYGATVTVRAGMRAQSRLCTGQGGGFNQSPLPLVFGLAGAPQADYARLHWPDGVAQVERALAAGRIHTVAETERKISSCPVLFTWNGGTFEFITDFAGVGGLGYFVGPGEYASPQPVDHVKIEPRQLSAREGRYELRIAEPMEESAYVDRLELLAIDHPAGWQVFPDERLTVTGPPPTRELLVVDEPIFARRAVNPAGLDCADELRHADRRYAFEPVLDRRFFGFCERHTLELDFGGQLDSLRAGERVFLFINGYLEYPYSQTAYAAGQARVGWEPIRVERRQPDGRWQTIVPDAGALGGMARTMTVDLTGLVGGADCRLRLTSNLEIYYDQIFLAVPAGPDRVTVHALPVAEAELRYVGFAREVSPDGRQPLIYDYGQTEPTAPFRTLGGAYTRYGPVRELLEEFDDRFVLVGSGDEIAAKFDATALPPLPDGATRSFVLVSHAWCKDMDLYTATPQTLEPMPFRGMSRYPYPPAERPPETEADRRARAAYNTRLVP